MADFVDFITAASVEDGNELANDLVAFLKNAKSADELKKWFDSQKRTSDGESFSGISLGDCEKILARKDGLIKYGDLVSVKNGY